MTTVASPQVATVPRSPAESAEGSLSVGPRDPQALVAQIMEGGITKNILAYSDKEQIANFAENFPSALTALYKLVEELPVYTADAPHPLRLMVLQGQPASAAANVIELAATFVSSDILKDVLTLIWHSHFAMGAIRAGSGRGPSELLSDAVVAQQTLHNYFPGTPCNPELAFLIPVILRHSKERVHDLGLLTGARTDTSSNEDLNQKLLDFYAAGHRYLPTLSCLAPKPKKMSKHTHLLELSAALAKHSEGFSVEESARLVATVSQFEAQEIARVRELVTATSGVKGGLEYAVDLVHLAKHHSASVQLFLGELPKVSKQQLSKCLMQACLVIRSRANVDSLLLVLKEQGAKAFLTAAQAAGDIDISKDVNSTIERLRADFSHNSSEVKVLPPKAALSRALLLYKEVLHYSHVLACESTHTLQHHLAAIKKEDPSLTDRKSVALFHTISRLLLERTNGFLPHHNQMMTVLLLGETSLSGNRGAFAQLATGEGKSAVIAMHAAFQAWSGRGVTVVTPTTYLARRDRDAFSGYFSLIGLTADVQSFTSQKQFTTLPSIVYTTVESIGFNELSRMLSYNSPFAPERFDYCICDEGDNLLLDSAAHALRIADQFENAGCTDFLQRLISLVDAADPDEESLEEVLQEFKDSDTFAQKLSEPVYELFCHGALHSRELVLGKHYVIKDNEIVPVSWRTNGRVQVGIHFGAGLHECLTLRNKLPAPKSVATVAQISVASLFNHYKNLTLVSGTFGDIERGELCETHKITGFDIPRQTPRLHGALGSTWAATELEWCQMIASRIQELRDTAPDRPVMVVTGSIAEAKIVHSYLYQFGIAAQRLTDYNNEGVDRRLASEGDIIANAGQPGVVTVATTVAGRGTDITLHPQARRAGGLHLIIGCFSLSERVEMQILGRASRQGDPGSSESIIASDKDTFLTSLPLPVTNCIREWVRVYGPNHPLCVSLIRLVREVVTCNEIEQRRVMRERAETAFAVLTKYLATRAESLGTVAPTGSCSVHREWLRFNTDLEAKLYGPSKLRTSFYVESDLGHLNEIFRRVFHAERKEVGKEVSPEMMQSLSAACETLKQMLEIREAREIVRSDESVATTRFRLHLDMDFSQLLS